MPQKNSVKEFEAGAYYHVYNRGVEKREIFLDAADYKKFIGYLSFYLKTPTLQGRALKAEDGTTIPPSRKNNNFATEIELHSYCLMPNHFHLLIRQINDRSMSSFMQSFITKYVMYFNKRYHRVGGLFQGKYKTVRVASEEQLKYLSKYIHRNPLSDYPTGSDLVGLATYRYSSYANYLGIFHQDWVKTDDVLHGFSTTNPYLTYRSFVEETGDIALVYKEMIDLDF